MICLKILVQVEEPASRTSNHKTFSATLGFAQIRRSTTSPIVSVCLCVDCIGVYVCVWYLWPFRATWHGTWLNLWPSPQTLEISRRTHVLTRTYTEYLTPVACTWTRNHHHLGESAVLLIQLCFHKCKKNPSNCLPDSLISLTQTFCIDHSKINQHSTNSFLRQDRPLMNI